MNGDWYDRLRAAIQKELDKGRSEREIGHAAGLSANYVNQIMHKRINAGSDNVLKLCRALNVSPSYIFSGIERGSIEEEAAAVLAGLSEREKRAWLQYLLVRRQ